MPAFPSKGARCAEATGGTVAECAAVICCCPCGFASLMILIVVRLPAGLCLKAIKKSRRKKKVASQQMKRCDDAKLREYEIELIRPDMPYISWPGKPPSAIVSEIQKEMATTMCATGFWRSISEREES